MDDRNGDRDVARIPTLEDLIRICRSLNERRAEYVVIGGFAVIREGYIRGTADIDFLIREDVSNIERVKEALLILEDRAARDLDPKDFEKFAVVRVADEVVVDLLTKACGQSFENLEEYIRVVDVKGVAIPFLVAEGLLKTKQGIRPKDADDRLFLEGKLKAEKRAKKKR